MQFIGNTDTQIKILSEFLNSEDIKSLAQVNNDENQLIQTLLRSIFSNYLNNIVIHLPTDHHISYLKQKQDLQNIQNQIIANDTNLLVNKNLQKITEIVVNILKNVHCNALKKLDKPPTCIPNFIDISLSLHSIPVITEFTMMPYNSLERSLLRNAITIFTEQKAWSLLFRAFSSDLNEKFVPFLCRNNEWELAELSLKKFNQSIVSQLSYTCFLQINNLTSCPLWLLCREPLDELSGKIKGFIAEGQYATAKKYINTFVTQHIYGERLIFLLSSFVEKQIQHFVKVGNLEVAKAYHEIMSDVLTKKGMDVLGVSIKEAKIDQLLSDDKIDEALSCFIAGTTEMHRELSAYRKMSKKIIDKLKISQDLEAGIKLGEKLRNEHSIEYIYVYFKASEMITHFNNRDKTKMDEVISHLGYLQYEVIIEVIKKLRDCKKNETFDFIKMIPASPTFQIKFCQSVIQPFIQEGDFENAKEIIKNNFPNGLTNEKMLSYIDDCKQPAISLKKISSLILASFDLVPEINQDFLMNDFSVLEHEVFKFDFYKSYFSYKEAIEQKKYAEAEQFKKEQESISTSPAMYTTKEDYMNALNQHLELVCQFDEAKKELATRYPKYFLTYKYFKEKIALLKIKYDEYFN